MDSALYVGKLRHRRFEPKTHEFSYPVYMAFLDIDELPRLMSVSRFSSYNRWNWTSYDERDHFGNPEESLRERLKEDARREGLELPAGKIFLLAHLRYLGYVFNPVSFYFCYNRVGQLEMMLSEVSNTFGETHNYWLTAANERPNPAAKQYRTIKEMPVSPFQSMELEYDWIFTAPGKHLVAHMNTLAQGTRNFDATLQLERRPWESKELLKVLLAYPLITLKVIAAIHWQALRLWLKRVPVHAHRPKLENPRVVAGEKGNVIV
jgi:uncharacterized protein